MSAAVTTNQTTHRSSISDRCGAFEERRSSDSDLQARRESQDKAEGLFSKWKTNNPYRESIWNDSKSSLASIIEYKVGYVDETSERIRVMVGNTLTVFPNTLEGKREILNLHQDYMGRVVVLNQQTIEHRRSLSLNL